MDFHNISRLVGSPFWYSMPIVYNPYLTIKHCSVIAETTKISTWPSISILHTSFQLFYLASPLVFLILLNIFLLILLLVLNTLRTYILITPTICWENGGGKKAVLIILFSWQVGQTHVALFVIACFPVLCRNWGYGLVKYLHFDSMDILYNTDYKQWQDTLKYCIYYKFGSHFWQNLLNNESHDA